MSGYRKIDVLIAVMAIAMIVVILLVVIAKQNRNVSNISQTIIIEPEVRSVEAISLNNQGDIERILASSTIDETIKDIIKKMPSPQSPLQ